MASTMLLYFTQYWFSDVWPACQGPYISLPIVQQRILKGSGLPFSARILPMRVLTEPLQYSTSSAASRADPYPLLDDRQRDVRPLAGRPHVAEPVLGEVQQHCRGQEESGPDDQGGSGRGQRLREVRGRRGADKRFLSGQMGAAYYCKAAL